ncbi:peptidase C11, clostripain [Seminavis robusta]|uniref:Peptidase C11, clostripain n=1 Tax=Seminavis robusta TaxID=568900 RepID=A0A9N8ER11_9STRA|nr:peptidase C11, clostripain [Seminavis robusta]|eukprot:Sro1545_g281290.1 peptidase C11, clostripain (774) ;mRNA; r:9288-11811
MFGVAMRKLLLVPLLMGVFPITSTDAKTCLMMYQLADNNLEFFIRQDYAELASSAVIRSEDLRVWVYYDAFSGTALPSTVDENGNPVGAFTGSRYITFDRSIGQMRVVRTFDSEINSDSPDTIREYLETALTDCLDNGFDSLMAVFSSHAGGFFGYGGDEHPAMRRLQPQTNQNVARAIRDALDNAAGGRKLDVLGFDACNMLAFGAADDYGEADVATYLLASEGLEPGHGWAYQFLRSAPDALTLATEIVATFVSRTQGSNFHQTPKTLAILDLQKFFVFLDAFEDFLGRLLPVLQAGDVTLHASVARSRTSAVSYEGILDSIGAIQPTSLDIGSWMAILAQLCNPGGDLGTSFQSARDTYADMFYYLSTGPGTPVGTGMHVLWPNQQVYFTQKPTFDTILFSDSRYSTLAAPNFRAFLQWFLENNNPGTGGTDTVCGGPSAVPVVEMPDPNVLIYGDTGTLNLETELFEVNAEIGPLVDQMVIEYAIDLSTPLKPVLESRGYTPNSTEYLYLKGGDLIGEYSGSNFTTSWDQNFYFLNISGIDQFEALYVSDGGDGSKRVHAMYFPEDKREEVSRLGFLDYLFFDFEYWADQGAVFSYLLFSVNETEGRINDNLSLFINDGNTYFEQPRENGGMLMPMVYIDAFIQDRNLTVLPGGFNQTVIDWSTELNYNILTTNTSSVFRVIPATDAVMVNVYAFDHGNQERGPEIRRYDVYRPTRSASTGSQPGAEEAGGDSQLGAEAGGESAGASGSMLHHLTNALLLLVVGLFAAI